MYFLPEQIGNTELSRQDTIKIQKSYGCDACGGPQYGSGGDIKAADSVTESSCTWWLTTDSNKQIDIEISVKDNRKVMMLIFYRDRAMQAEFSGTCEENYLEIRLGQWNGKVVKKFCSGVSSGSVSTNSNGVYVKWVKKADTASSFSGKWTTTTVTCCSKIAMETPWDNVNGIYNFDKTAGHYKRESGEFILFQKSNFNGYSGWLIGTDKNSASLLNPVSLLGFLKKVFNVIKFM